MEVKYHHFTNFKLFDRCDFIRDCPDNTDERDCECKPPLRFQCGNGYCVDASKKCDGTTDCSDGTDGEGKKSHVEGSVLHFSDPGNLVYRTKISLTLHGQIRIIS